MLQNSIFSVISPEGCASILFRDSDRAPEAADAMMVTAGDLKELGIADIVLEEPNGGNHINYDSAAELLKSSILKSFVDLLNIDPHVRIKNRIKKFEKMGRWNNE